MTPGFRHCLGLLARQIESHVMPGREAETSGSDSWASKTYPGRRLVPAGGEGADGHDERRRRSKSSCRNEPARMCADLLAPRVVSRDMKLCRLGRLLCELNKKPQFLGPNFLQIRGDDEILLNMLGTSHQCTGPL